jgi:hypothetical protein
MATYRLSGHLIETQIPLDEYAGVVSAAVIAPDIVVTRAAAAPERAVPPEAFRNRIEIDGEPVLSVAVLAGRPLLRVHGYADFLVDRHGREVECTPVPRCPPDALAQVVVDRLLPHLLSYRGVPTLHASALALASPCGAAVAFVGDPGAGKSTIAGALSPPLLLLCDDCAALEIGTERVYVHPSYPLVRLRGDAASHLAPDGPKLARSPQRNIKWRFPRAAADRARPLFKIYAIERDARGTIVEALSPRDVVAELARHLYRLDPTDRGRLGEELALLEHVACSVAVARLHYRPGLQALASITEAVLSDLRATGVE